MKRQTAAEIEAAIQELVLEIHPGAGFTEKYGGQVILPNPADEKTFVGGTFIHRRHVSLEFSQGASFNDPDGLLEGTGRHRRHLKLTYVEDIEDHQVAFFLRQALGK